MKIALVALAVLNIVVGLVGCIVSLGSSIFVSILCLAGGAMGSVPYFALIYVLEGIDDLRESQQDVQSKLRRLLDAAEAPSEHDVSGSGPAQPFSKETSRHTWKCVRCQTVNKPGTSSCSNCGAHYSPWISGEG